MYIYIYVYIYIYTDNIRHFSLSGRGNCNSLDVDLFVVGVLTVALRVSICPPNPEYWSPDLRAIVCMMSFSDQVVETHFESI